MAGRVPLASLVEVWGRRGQRRVDKYGGRVCVWVPVLCRYVVVYLEFPFILLYDIFFWFWRAMQVAIFFFRND
jgi:hypothetical protein